MDELTAREVEELVAQYPLLAGVPDATVNRSELAEFFGVSMLTISNWITAGMPVKSKGGQGQAYELQLSECWAWKCARDRTEQMRSEQARAAIEAQRLALVGGGVGDTIEALDPKTRREIIAAQIEDERFRAARKQLLQRDAVHDLLDELFRLMRDTMEAAPDRVERETGADAVVISALVDVCDGVVEELDRRIRAFWEINRENSAAVERQSLFDA